MKTTVPNRPRRALSHIFVALVATLSVLGISLRASAQGYVQLNYISDIKGPGQRAFWKDVKLANPWGIAFSPAGPIWISNAGTGTSTLYNGRILGLPFPSLKRPLVVMVPPGSASPGEAQGKPTGVVFNDTSDFVVSQDGGSGPALFIFATLDGTISGWSPAVNFASAIVSVDNSASEARYTGLALGRNSTGNFLYAANAESGSIEVFDKNFAPVVCSMCVSTTFAGSFVDPTLPNGFVPFNVQNIGGKLYVTYTSFASGAGRVVIFDTDGNFMQSFTADALNLPWGMALAPANFGQFSNDLLVGNLGDGLINAFDPSTGTFLGQLSDRNGHPITIDHLWGLAFGNGVLAGRTNDLLFTAGIQMEAHGLFGVIRALSH